MLLFLRGHEPVLCHIQLTMALFAACRHLTMPIVIDRNKASGFVRRPVVCAFVCISTRYETGASFSPAPVH